MPVTFETDIDGVIRAYSDIPGDSEFTAAVITALLRDDDPVARLTPLLKPYLTRRRRALVRSIEQSAWRGRPDGAPAPAPGGNTVREQQEAIVRDQPVMLDRLLPLLTEMIYIPGLGLLPWGQATAAQLQARIEMFAGQKAALDDGIADMQRAITLIRDHPGATCLNDIYENAS